MISDITGILGFIVITLTVLIGSFIPMVFFKNKLKRFVNTDLIFMFYFCLMIFSGQSFIMNCLHIFLLFLNIFGTLALMKKNNKNDPKEEFINEYNGVIKNGVVKRNE